MAYPRLNNISFWCAPLWIFKGNTIEQDNQATNEDHTSSEPKTLTMSYILILISMGTDVMYSKSFSLPNSEMDRGPEHAENALNEGSKDLYDERLDNIFTIRPNSVDGAYENPIGIYDNTNYIDPTESGQSSIGASSITSDLQNHKNTGSNKITNLKESTAGFPKGSNSYGDGVPILFFSRVQVKKKVGQRYFSTGTDAANSGTDLRLKLVKLENGKFTNLFKTLADINLLLSSYHKIKSKPGNMTPGTDEQTLDAISINKINELVKRLLNETFKFKPVRRVLIPKANGKTRPLGSSSPMDKIVQESMRAILEAIFEPLFLECSHGFRKNKSCHSALKEVSKWNGFTWAIEGSIKGEFDNVDHHILEGLLKEKIEDQQFIDLYWKLVKAGYVEKGVSFNSPLGVPQGGIVSPILSNIYLHQLDIFMTNYIETNSSTEKHISKVNPKMTKYSDSLTELNTLYQENKNPQILKEIKDLRMERNLLPSRIRTGIRIKYVRYADDWLVGIIGDMALANSLKTEITYFLYNKLKIMLSPEKTKITHLHTEKARFLGVNIYIPKPDESKIVLRKGIHGPTYARVNHVRIFFQMPTMEIIAKLSDEGFLKNYPTKKYDTNAITKWVFLDHRSIIIKYNAIINGFLNYYSFVDNFCDFHLIINYILRHSCAKTLARKLNLASRAAVFKVFGYDLTTKDGKPMKLKTLPSMVKTRKFNVSTNYSDPMAILKWKVETLSTLENECRICGLEEDIEMHHVKHLKKGISPNQKAFTKLMATLNRKQIPVCKECHLKIHKGVYDGLPLNALKQKKKGD